MSGKKKARNAVAQARSSSRRGGLLITGGAVVVLALLIGGVTVAVINSSKAQQATAEATNLSNPPATTAAGRDLAPPWPAPADAAAGVRAAGLPMLSAEGTVEHLHAHLDIQVNGQTVAVPADIGIDQAHNSISPLHTHDTTGVLHIESPVKRQFTLGELFSEWGVSLSADNIGSLRNTGDKAVRVYVNGTLKTGNPAAVTFTAHDEIALIYGPLPASGSVPSHYDFQAGE